MKYTTEETVVVVADKDGFKFTSVYTLERSSRNEYGTASVRTTVPRYANVDAVFDLATSDEPIDFIPDYVADELDAAESDYIDEARALTAAAINLMDACLAHEYEALDTMYVEGFGKTYATFESTTDAKAN